MILVIIHKKKKKKKERLLGSPFSNQSFASSWINVEMEMRSVKKKKTLHPTKLCIIWMSKGQLYIDDDHDNIKSPYIHNQTRYIKEKQKDTTWSSQTYFTLTQDHTNHHASNLSFTSHNHKKKKILILSHFHYHIGHQIQNQEKWNQETKEKRKKEKKLKRKITSFISQSQLKVMLFQTSASIVSSPCCGGKCLFPIQRVGT